MVDDDTVDRALDAYWHGDIWRHGDDDHRDDLRSRMRAALATTAAPGEKLPADVRERIAGLHDDDPIAVAERRAGTEAGRFRAVAEAADESLPGGPPTDAVFSDDPGEPCGEAHPYALADDYASPEICWRAAGHPAGDPTAHWTGEHCWWRGRATADTDDPQPDRMWSIGPGWDPEEGESQPWSANVFHWPALAEDPAVFPEHWTWELIAPSGDVPIDGHAGADPSPLLDRLVGSLNAAAPGVPDPETTP